MPLRPDPLAIRSAASRSFARAFVASAFAAIESRRPDDAIEIAPKIWPEDRYGRRPSMPSRITRARLMQHRQLGSVRFHRSDQLVLDFCLDHLQPLLGSRGAAL
jgi:hypothetical protein